MDGKTKKNARMRVESLWRCPHISHVVLMSDFLWKWNFLELPTRFHHLITGRVVVVWREIVIFIWKTGREERCAESGSLDNEQKLHSKSFDIVPRWSMRGAETRGRFLELKLIFQFFYVARWRYIICYISWDFNWIQLMNIWVPIQFYPTFRIENIVAIQDSYITKSSSSNQLSKHHQRGS